jgi:hypothetical protein
MAERQSSAIPTLSGFAAAPCEAALDRVTRACSLQTPQLGLPVKCSSVVFQSDLRDFDPFWKPGRVSERARPGWAGSARR